MQRTFEKLTANRNAYFAEALDDFCTLRTQNPAAAAAAISIQRKADMTKLGALVALMIIGGWTPGALDPLFVYFLVHECNFDCLTPEIVEEWHPELALMIKRWIQVGPNGDITPFESHLMSYHEIQVSPSTHIPRLYILIQCLLSAFCLSEPGRIDAFCVCRGLSGQGRDQCRRLPSSRAGGIHRRLCLTVPCKRLYNAKGLYRTRATHTLAQNLA